MWSSRSTWFVDPSFGMALRKAWSQVILAGPISALTRRGCFRDQELWFVEYCCNWQTGMAYLYYARVYGLNEFMGCSQQVATDWSTTHLQPLAGLWGWYTRLRSLRMNSSNGYPKTYSIRKVYKACSCSQLRLCWDKIVWHQSSVPKARFVM